MSIRFHDERRNVPTSYLLDNSIFSELEHLVPLYDFPDEPPPTLLPFLRKEQVPLATENKPEWFRPDGVTDIDIDAGFIPRKTILRVRQKVESIWDQNKVPFLVADAASGKTSLLRVLSKYWTEYATEIFYISAAEWSWEIASEILVVARSQKLIIIIDDLHRRNEINLKPSYLAKVFSNPNVKGIIASRPRRDIENMLSKIPIERIRILKTYPQELIHNYIQSRAEEPVKNKNELIKILERHQHNIASLVYELQEPFRGSKAFWQNFVKKACKYYAHSEKTEPRRWEILILILSFLRTKEISISLEHLVEFIKADLVLPVQDVERMLFVLEENGLVIREFSYNDEKSKFRFSYHSVFSNMLLKEKLWEFKHLVGKRVEIDDDLAYRELTATLWAWWVSNATLSSLELYSITKNLGNLWKELPLDGDKWKEKISRKKDVRGVQIAILGEDNNHIKGQLSSWIIDEHWISWFLSTGVETRAEILDYWIAYTSEKEVKSHLANLDLKLLENVEWKEDLGSVFDPGGGGFGPADVHLGYADLGYGYVAKLSKLLGKKWLSLCARFIASCVQRGFQNEFEELLDRLSTEDLQLLPKNELPTALDLGKNIEIPEYRYLHEDQSKFSKKLTCWNGPKPVEIATAIYQEFVEALVNGNNTEIGKLLDTNRTEEWIRALLYPEINQQLDKSKIIGFLENQPISISLTDLPDARLAFLIYFLHTWIPNELESLITPTLIDRLSLKIDRWNKKKLLALPRFKRLLIGNLTKLSSKTTLTWIKQDILLLAELSDSTLHDLICSEPDLEWFTVLEEIQEIIELPEFMDPGDKEKAAAKAKIASGVLEKVIRSMGSIPNTIIKSRIAEIVQKREFNHFNFKNFTNSIFKAEPLLETTIFDDWNEVVSLTNKIPSDFQHIFLATFLEAHTKFISELIQIIIESSSLISLDVIIGTFLELDNNLIYMEFPKILRYGITYSHLVEQSKTKYRARFTIHRFINLINLQKDPELFLDEFLPLFLKEPLDTVTEIIYSLIMKEKLVNVLLGVLQKNLNPELVIQILKQDSNARKMHVLKYLENNGFNILDKLDQTELIDILVESQFTHAFLLRSARINSQLIEKYYQRVKIENSIFNTILRDLNWWIKAGRDPSIFILGIETIIDENLIKNVRVRYQYVKEYSLLLEHCSEAAVAVRNVTKGWLTTNNKMFDEKLLKIIKKAWGHPDALKIDIMRWNKEDQQNALRTLVGLNIPQYYSYGLNYDWSINLFSQELRIELFTEIVKWSLFDQNTSDLKHFIKLITLDSSFAKACTLIAESDWKNAVLFDSYTETYIILLHLLATLSQTTNSPKYLMIGQEILNEEKSLQKIQELLAFQSSFSLKEEKENVEEILGMYNWEIPIQTIQDDPSRFCRIYHNYILGELSSHLTAKEISALIPEKIMKLSYKQITAFLVSLPKGHSSPFVDYLQNILFIFLQKNKCQDLFGLLAILSLPYGKRKHFYDNITSEFLVSIDWDIIEYEITNYHCEEATQGQFAFKIPYRLVFDSYLLDYNGKSIYCEICELYPRSELVEEIWQDLIDFLPQETDRAIVKIKNKEIQELYSRLKTINPEN
ncbi:MAG: hypothetical protein ACXADY_09915 [Candidatus Hodarchaeales archaeon]